MTDEEKKQIMREFAGKGGNKTKLNNGLNYYREIGRKGAKKRWGDKLPTVENSKPLTSEIEDVKVYIQKS